MVSVMDLQNLHIAYMNLIRKMNNGLVLAKPLILLVGRGGFEPPTNGLKVLLSALSTTNQNNLKQLNQ